MDHNEVVITNPTTGGTKTVKLARFDLIPADALMALAEHYGKGALKYDERNWERGYAWSLSFQALQRHVWQFWEGEDFDEQTGSHHMIAAAWHAFALYRFSRTHPELDDRPRVVKLALDVDGVIADFVSAAIELAQNNGLGHLFPKSHDEWRDYYHPLMDELWVHINEAGERFWMSIKPYPEKLPIKPVAYITSRRLRPEITEAWLFRHGFPHAPVITVANKSLKREAIVQVGAAAMVEDDPETMTALNSAGIRCFLMDRPWNRHVQDLGLRIHSLRELVRLAPSKMSPP